MDHGPVNSRRDWWNKLRTFIPWSTSSTRGDDLQRANLENENIIFFMEILIIFTSYILLFSFEVCRVCESAGRVKIYFTPNTTHKCPHGGADKGTFSVWCMTHDWIYFFEIAKTSSWTMSKKRKELNLLRTRRSGEYLSFLECYLFFFLRFVKSVKERRRLSTSSRRKYLNIWGTVLITRRRRVTFVLQKLYYFYDETFTCTTRKRV